jgi:DNA-binding NarL/FixJ family response regulator
MRWAVDSDTLSLISLRCLIVDDSEAFLASARRLLETDEVHVVGVASSGEEAIRLAEELRPDVALVDVELREEDGFEVARVLATGRRTLQVVLISTYSENDLADLIAESPAVGFLPKSRLTVDAVLKLADQRESR